MNTVGVAQEAEKLLALWVQAGRLSILGLPIPPEVLDPYNQAWANASDEVLSHLAQSMADITHSGITYESELKVFHAKREAAQKALAGGKEANQNWVNSPDSSLGELGLFIFLDEK